MALAWTIAAALALGACGDRETPASDSNVLLVTRDTTRADRFGGYGYARDTTPNFDAFDGYRWRPFLRAPVDSKAAKRLRSLGYLGDD